MAAREHLACIGFSDNTNPFVFASTAAQMQAKPILMQNARALGDA
jgi:hypothetical protein